MDPPPIEEVLQAIHALYNDPNPQEKEKASAWLGKLQKSVRNFVPTMMYVFVLL